MKYATFGQDGKLNGRYDSEIHTPEQIPVGAVEIPDDLFSRSINDQSGYLELVTGTVMWTVPPPQPLAIVAAQLKLSANARINAAYESAVSSLTSGYPASEIASWPKQEDEARSWTANNSAPTPWMDAAVTTRGITKADLAAKIISNADLFTSASGQLSGKRQKLRDQINAFGDEVTQAQLDAIQW